VLRPRTLVYATLLAVLVAGFAVTLSGATWSHRRDPRPQCALPRAADGRIENVYNVKILNKDRNAHEFRITASGLPGVEVDYIGPTVWVAPGAVQSVPVRIRVPRGELQGAPTSSWSLEAWTTRNSRPPAGAFIAPTD